MTSSSPRIFAPSSLQIQSTNNDPNPSSLSTSRDKHPHSSVVIHPFKLSPSSKDKLDSG